VASVNIDYVEAIDEATSTLVRHGNEKIAFVTGSLNEPINGQYRLKGYKKALAQAKIAYDPNLVFETEYSYKAGEAIWDRVKAAGATAAVIGDDELAIGLLNGAGDDGVNVPDDFELITSNDSKLTEISRPKMSSITQPLYDIGAVAMRLLTKMMNKEDIDNQTILLPYGIVERGTTK
jgi:LacI family transcriptional regulator